jgi:hypothetical protein
MNHAEDSIQNCTRHECTLLRCLIMAEIDIFREKVPLALLGAIHTVNLLWKGCARMLVCMFVVRLRWSMDWPKIC